jgi:hypothetical protein
MASGWRLQENFKGIYEVAAILISRIVGTDMCPVRPYGKHVRGCIQKFPDWIDKEIYAYNDKGSSRNNTKGYGGKTHWTDPQNSDITISSGRELYHLQFSLQEASPETFGYALVVGFLPVCPSTIIFF